MKDTENQEGGDPSTAAETGSEMPNKAGSLKKRGNTKSRKRIIKTSK